MRGGGGHQQRIAVGGCFGSVLGADITVGTRTVIYDDRLPPGFGQFLADGAGKNIGSAGRRISYDDTYRFVWICVGGEGQVGKRRKRHKRGDVCTDHQFAP